MNIINTGASCNRKKRDSVHLHQLQNPKSRYFLSSSLLFEPLLTWLPTLPLRASSLPQFNPVSFDPMPMVSKMLWFCYPQTNKRSFTTPDSSFPLQSYPLLQTDRQFLFWETELIASFSSFSLRFNEEKGVFLRGFFLFPSVHLSLFDFFWLLGIWVCSRTDFRWVCLVVYWVSSDLAWELRLGLWLDITCSSIFSRRMSRFVSCSTFFWCLVCLFLENILFLLRIITVTVCFVLDYCSNCFNRQCFLKMLSGNSQLVWGFSC